MKCLQDPLGFFSLGKHQHGIIGVSHQKGASAQPWLH